MPWPMDGRGWLCISTGALCCDHKVGPLSVDIPHRSVPPGNPKPGTFFTRSLRRHSQCLLGNGVEKSPLPQPARLLQWPSVTWAGPQQGPARASHL